MQNRTRTIFAYGMVFALLFSSCSGVGIGKKTQEPTKEESGESVDDKGATETEEFKQLLASMKKENIAVPLEIPQITPKTAPYSVLMEDVQIPEKIKIEPHEAQLLETQYFFIKQPSTEYPDRYLFHIYDTNMYSNRPSFVTTDVALHTFHLFYDNFVRKTEETQFLPQLEKFTVGMLKALESKRGEINDEEVQDLLEHSIAYFSVAADVLGVKNPVKVDEAYMDRVQKEIQNIDEGTFFGESGIVHNEVDFSQFKPRGHYTKNENLQRYFRGMMYYGLLPLRYDTEGGIDREMTLMALVMTKTVFADSDLFGLWEDIYEPTAFLVGDSDDLGFEDYGRLYFNIYGKDSPWDDLNDKERFDQFVEAANQLKSPEITPKVTEVDVAKGRNFRVMGQRYILDSEIIQKIAEPMKYWYISGLDLFAALGSKEAEKYQKEMITPEAPEYETYLKRGKDVAQTVTEKDWMKNIYYGWLWTLQGLTKRYGEGWPSFMQKEAWAWKDLNTALCSWAELRHDTILYAKQSMAEMGGMMMDEEIPAGYVEPNIELYAKLLRLTKYTRLNLENRGLLDEKLKTSVEDMEKFMETLLSISVKELQEESLSKEENEFIRTIGGLLEKFQIDFSEKEDGTYRLMSEENSTMALISDYHTVAPNSEGPGGVMEAAVGLPHEIYVVVPINGKLYLTIGSVMRYYEFLSQERLTDEQWIQMLKTSEAPKGLDWQKSIFASVVNGE